MQNVLARSHALVVEPSGTLTSENVIQFQRHLNSAVLSDDTSSLLIDLGQVELIDSDALMALVSSLAMAQRLNKRFSLCSMSRSVRMIFELTQLDRVFEIFDERSAFEAAIA